MNKNTLNVMFSLIGSALFDKPVNEGVKSLVSEELLSDIRLISNSHDLTHIVMYGLAKNGMISSEETRKDILSNILRFENMEYELGELCNALEHAKISFIPLKGAYIRKYYKEPWMRTSCDIDVLVHEEDIERATEYLISNHNYTCDNKGSHDYSLYSPNNIHIELHYKLVEEKRANDVWKVLEKTWHYSKVKDGYKYWHEMSDEMFYFYHIAHIAKHFENGGCGIKQFIDLYILDNISGFDIEKRNLLLEKGNLLTFADASGKLAGIWFDGGDYDDISKELESYVISGGAYGSLDNRIIIQQNKRGGKFRYAMSRIFLPHSYIKFRYPILDKHKWLTPFFEVYRWFDVIFFCKRGKIAMYEMKYNRDLSENKADSASELLKNIGLL